MGLNATLSLRGALPRQLQQVTCASGVAFCATRQNPPPDVQNCVSNAPGPFDPSTPPSCTNTVFNVNQLGGPASCGKCYAVTLLTSGKSTCVYTVDAGITNGNTFEIDQPGWEGNLCPRVDDNNRCGDEGRFAGIIAGPQPIEFEE